MKKKIIKIRNLNKKFDDRYVLNNINLDLYEKEFDYIRQVSDKLSKYEVVLFLGTGGSSLGGRTLVSYVRNFYYNYFFVLSHRAEIWPKTSN